MTAKKKKLPAKRAPARPRMARVEIRTERHHKDLIERAANLTGQPVSAFIMSAATSHAREVIRDSDQLVLADDARDALLDLLDKAPAPPSRALRSAMDRHRREIDGG